MIAHGALMLTAKVCALSGRSARVGSVEGGNRAAGGAHEAVIYMALVGVIPRNSSPRADAQGICSEAGGCAGAGSVERMYRAIGSTHEAVRPTIESE